MIEYRVRFPGSEALNQGAEFRLGLEKTEKYFILVKDKLAQNPNFSRNYGDFSEFDQKPDQALA